MKTSIIYAILMLTVGALVSAVNDIPFYGERKLLHEDDAIRIECDQYYDDYGLVRMRDKAKHSENKGRELFYDFAGSPGCYHVCLFDSDNVLLLKMMHEKFGKELFEWERLTAFHAALHAGQELALAKWFEQAVRTFGCKHAATYGRNTVRMHTVLTLMHSYWEHRDINVHKAILYWQPSAAPSKTDLEAYGCIHPLERVQHEQLPEQRLFITVGLNPLSSDAIQQINLIGIKDWDGLDAVAKRLVHNDIQYCLSDYRTGMHIVIDVPNITRATANSRPRFDWVSPNAVRTFKSVDHQAIYKQVISKLHTPQASLSAEEIQNVVRGCVAHYFGVVDIVEQTLSVDAVAKAYATLEPIFFNNFCALSREKDDKKRDIMLQGMYKKVMSVTHARSSFIMKDDIAKLNAIGRDVYGQFCLNEEISAEVCKDIFKQIYKEKYCPQHIQGDASCNSQGKHNE